MRILHTSDLHLGRSLGPISLHDDQVAFTEWVLGVIAEQHIDLLVVAGDLYDRAIAPNESVALWRSVLQRLAGDDIRVGGVPVVAIAGNHDGADRVAAYDGLTDRAGILVRGGYDRAGEVTTLQFADGPLDILAVPFLDPVLAPPAWKDELAARDESRTHESVLRAALDRARESRTGSAVPRSLVVAHAFVAGSSVSDSERQLSVGGTDRVGADALQGFSYVALGHLHMPQLIGGDPTIRYSGTPLPYSFSEVDPKSVVLIDMAPDGTCEVSTLAVPIGRPVATITGTIDSLLAPDAHPDLLDHFIRAVLTDGTYVLDAKKRLVERYPHLIEVSMALTGSTVELGGPVEVQARRSPLESATEFWADVVGSDLTALQLDTLTAALDEAFIGTGGDA